MGRYLDIIRQIEEAHKQTGQDNGPVQWQSYPVGGLSLVPGNWIAWQGADGTERSGVVDFFHTDADGIVWAFCTPPEGRWCAVNTKHCTKSEPA